jgi:DNA-binding SARP family transcriptional activator
MPIIRLLGGASIERGEGDSRGRVVQRTRIALLAALAVSRTRSASRERLMALLWPEHDTGRARHLLRENLYRLRETFGDDVLLSDGDDVRLNGALQCDVWDFEAAVARRDWVAADRLYAGALLDGFFLTDAPDFEALVAEERRRLAELHAQSVEALAAERSARHEWPEAIALWRRRVVADPYNARVVLRLMESLDAAGDRAAALKQAAMHASLLESELGATPDPAVLAFAEQLRRSPRRSHGLEPPVPARSENGDEVAADFAPTGNTENHSARTASDLVPTAPVNTTRRLRWRIPIVTLASMAVLVTGFIGVRVLAAVDLDPDRIAIAPLRVSGAQGDLAFLSSGLVELLSLEFRGSPGPVAVDAGDVLRAAKALRRADPPRVADAVAVARRVNAAQVVYSSLAGNASRLTISASIIDASTGSERIPAVRVSGPLDSLSSMIGELAARLMTGGIGSWALRSEHRDRASTQVLRVYLAGMNAYRNANWRESATQLIEAMRLDSTFTPAAFRFALLHAMTAPFGPLPEVSVNRGFSDMYRRLWSQRRSLPLDHQRLLEAIADSQNVLWPGQVIPRLEQLVTILPNSVEAHDILGSALFHAGAYTGRADWIERARFAFGRALLLDSVIAVKAQMRLADQAFIERDRRAFDRYATRKASPRGPEYLTYLAAILHNDAVAVEGARVSYSRSWARGHEDGIDWALRGLTLPQHELDALLAQLEADALTDDQRHRVAEWKLHAAYMGGRPRAAERLLGRVWQTDSAMQYSIRLDQALDPRSAEQWFLHQLASRPMKPGTPEPWNHPMACNVALSRLRRGDTTGVSDILGAQAPFDTVLPAVEALKKIRRGVRAQSALCGQVLRGIVASINSSGMSALWRADSLMRNSPLNYADWWNYDLAIAFAKRGEYGAAVAASQRYFIDLLPLPKLVPMLRDRGRWALLAGDTASAANAFREYLLRRESPEPELMPQRDSVRGDLAAIERAGWKSRASGRR